LCLLIEGATVLAHVNGDIEAAQKARRAAEVLIAADARSNEDVN
jgi:hypothetical protein